ncbi:unnamed protein product [Phytophthora fragariaefolia]|uniref:Unnamed protein product n=1 Tax=Phytophthora fragariaefolia TaxID=1490495 RepID=A0A9W6TQ93_9STRA|nr:unnamed protein product [Phytophthora fragariaefolia]
MLLQTDAHTSVAAVTMEVVDIQTLANAANFALVAMINVFAVIVVDKPAHLTVVATEFAFAIFVDAGFTNRLNNNHEVSEIFSEEELTNHVPELCCTSYTILTQWHIGQKDDPHCHL